MDLSEEWKSVWPISSVFSAPLLLNNDSGGGGHPLGPLIFNPNMDTRSLLLSSSFLSSFVPPSFPQLSLSRFLSTTPSPNNPSSLLPSIASSIACEFGPHQSVSPEISTLGYNCLQFLRCPLSSSLLVLFPTGENSDQVGFVLLSVKEGKLSVQCNGNDGIFKSKNKFNHRILRLLVNSSNGFPCSSGKSSIHPLGYVMACTMYSVHWFTASIMGIGSNEERPFLHFVGSKLFKSNSVAHACWNPHLPHESVVLLSHGRLFLFDLESYAGKESLDGVILGKKLHVPWDDEFNNMRHGRWLSCEFSWHPRILIVVHSSAIFLVDLRSDSCKKICLLKIQSLAMTMGVMNDRFTTFCKVSSDGFYFVVATNRLLLLCDIRKPMMPLLQWAHDLPTPSYISVYPLSEMRSHSKDQYKWASDSGYCIILGSFWNCQFSVFCYGPPPKGTVSSKISKFSKQFYAWGLPSQLPCPVGECHCGSCLVRDEFEKDALPEWVDWRQKKEIVIGFGILDKDLHNQLHAPEMQDSFTLIRLMSSGKLESLRYQASWEFMGSSEKIHKDSVIGCKDSLMYSSNDGEYRFPKKFKYLKLDYLASYISGDLDSIALRKTMKSNKRHYKKGSSSEYFNEYICEKVKQCGLDKNVFKEIPLPMSIYEVASRIIWSSLPTNILQQAFSCYSEVIEVLLDNKEVSLEFLDVPEQPQLPPFFFRAPSCRSNKWSGTTKPGSSLVGPILPLPVLLSLSKLEDKGENFDNTAMELTRRCNDVLKVAKEIVTGSSSLSQNDDAVSLADAMDEVPSETKKKEGSLVLLVPSAFSHTQSDIDVEEERFTMFALEKRVKGISRNDCTDTVGSDLFDDMCPTELKFIDDSFANRNFGPKEMKAYRLLKKQHNRFLGSFDMYQEFSKSKTS
ncbi:uncharacterized protein LOC124919711 [Impatiens glandulifera]|uniref:uncharacterized protein LOC124919711 n=1 Tax=Impatiens glandulifera TaxID=253017 RepID=UPI001FB0BB62|nr:uncharacterized protein LOC124919711 [Impatiens glandulifera]XP_047315988.1 uncharacterized protein LOC124919711 [Impatiens glandulifera]